VEPLCISQGVTPLDPIATKNGITRSQIELYHFFVVTYSFITPTIILNNYAQFTQLSSEPRTQALVRGSIAKHRE